MESESFYMDISNSTEDLTDVLIAGDESIQALIDLNKIIQSFNEENSLCLQKRHDTARSKKGSKQMEDELEEAVTLHENDLAKIQDSEIAESLKMLDIKIENEYFIVEVEMSDEIQTLKSEIDTIINKENPSTMNISTPFCSEANKKGLLLENQELSEEILVRQELLDDLVKSIASVKNAIGNTSNFLIGIEETITSVKSEYLTLKEEINALSEELVFLSSQKNILNSKPQSLNSRGNSLFGEIDAKKTILVKKIKELKKAYLGKKQAIARSYSTLKKLKYDSIARQNSKKAEAALAEKGPDHDEEILLLNQTFNELKDQCNLNILVFDLEEGDDYMNNYHLRLNWKREELKSKREKLIQSSAESFELGEKLCNMKLNFIDLQTSILFEEDKKEKLSAICEYLNKSTLEINDESFQNKLSGYSLNETADGLTALNPPASTLSKDNPQPEKKERPPIKFVNVLNMVNLDDL